MVFKGLIIITFSEENKWEALLLEGVSPTSSAPKQRVFTFFAVVILQTPVVENMQLSFAHKRPLIEVNCDLC